ncbi:MAG: GNAT family N-acyltransferase [Bacteroidota bacterium]
MKKITFKEIQEIEELEKCLILRYEHFNNSQYRIFLNGNKSGIDIDEFDKYSRHWILIDEENEIIGYARIIQKRKNSEIFPLIKQIQRKYSLTNHVNSNKAISFPIMTYQTDKSKSSLESFLNTNTEKEAFELSRFIIKKGSSFRVSKFMVNAGLSIYKNCFQAEIVILACIKSHEKFWRRYGFTNIKEEETYKLDN